MRIGAISGYTSPYSAYALSGSSSAASSGVNTGAGTGLSGDTTTGTGSTDSAGKASADETKQVAPGRKSSPAECETCRNRKYQDGSNESDVSFKAPGHISPAASRGTVMAHEQEHVANAYQKAAEGNGRVISATVSLQVAVCPECGTTYVAGGLTNTVVATEKESSGSSSSNPYVKNQQSLMNAYGSGGSIDIKA